MGLILLILLILFLGGGLYSGPRIGYGPSGLVGVLLIILIVMLVAGHLSIGF